MRIVQHSHEAKDAEEIDNENFRTARSYMTPSCIIQDYTVEVSNANLSEIPYSQSLVKYNSNGEKKIFLCHNLVFFFLRGSYNNNVMSYIR